ncbi:SDR family NAD(P)-dependent oxidoreductase [Tsukamurella soli]|uniref:SDR family oxidoreductase n=1 Tax=Tsukamurella soli TaxID=644556 RepID=A0ABP8JL61_9ACTN
MDLGLAGRVALVTGGSRGIGKACARALLAEGAHVALLARGADALAAAAAELGTGVLTVRADTTDARQVQNAVDAVVAEFGRLDIVVNSAAQPASVSSVGTGIEGTDPAEALAQVDTKVLGYLRVARAAAPYLRAAVRASAAAGAPAGAAIINVSGMNARRTGSIAGSIRNIGVVALAQNLADELGPDGIAVTVVHPGMTRTDSRELTPGRLASAEANALGRVVDAAEIADIVCFLASPRAAALNGAVLEADGGRPGTLYV